MNWFFIALIAPVLWAITNHFDKYLLTKYFKGGSVGALMIFSALIGVFVLPVIYLIHPAIFSIKLIFAVLITLNGFLYVLSLLPYLYALAKDEASIVVPLYQLVPVFSYGLAYFALNERLSGLQILASVLIIVGAVALSIEFNGNKTKFKSQVFWLMVLASFLVALNGLIFKFVAIKEDFWTTSFWEYVGLALFALFLLIFIKSYRRQFLKTLKENRSLVISINGVNEVVNIIAKIAMNFATLLAPLALVWVVNGFQPLFVFIFGIILTLFLPQLGEERIEKKYLLQKILAIIVMFIGTYLLNIF